jgi:hypothetical protein
MDNSSREFSLAKVKEMIQHQREVYAWDFVFMGANIDAFSVGGGLGIMNCSTRSFVATKEGVSSSWDDLTQSYGCYKTLDRSVVRDKSFEFNTQQ